MTDSVQVFPVNWRATDANANVVPGAKLKFYDAGTSTPKTVYSNEGLSTSLGVTVTCLADGSPANGSSARVLVYVGTAAYKLEIYDASDVLVPGMSFDNIKGAVVATATATAVPYTPVDSETSDFIIDAADLGHIKDVNTAGGNRTVTLMSSATATNGKWVGICKNGSANTLTIAADGSETINGASTYTLNSDNDSVILVADGANWVVLSDYNASSSSWQNARLEKSSANYTVLAADTGRTIALSGNTVNSLIFPTPTSFNTAHINMVVNETVWSSGGRAKLITLTGNNEFPTFWLWPGQSAMVYLQNNIWRVLRPERWKLPSSSVTIYVDATNGNDTTADGLGTTTGAKKTITAAYIVYRDLCDCNGAAPTIKLADGTYSESLRCAAIPVGSTGTQLNIVGNNSTPANVIWKPDSSSGFCLSSKDGGIVTVTGCKFQEYSSGSGGVALFAEGQGCVIDFNFVNFGVFSSGYHIRIADGGWVNALYSDVSGSGYTVSSASTALAAHCLIGGGGRYLVSGKSGSNNQTITISGAMNLGYFIQAIGNNARVEFGSSITWAGSGTGNNSSATGQYSITYTAFFDRGGSGNWNAAASTGAPGNTAGTSSTQGQVI